MPKAFKGSPSVALSPRRPHHWYRQGYRYWFSGPMPRTKQISTPAHEGDDLSAPECFAQVYFPPGPSRSTASVMIPSMPSAISRSATASSLTV